MSFEEMYHKYYKQLFWFAVHLGISQNEADDVVQEAFTKLFVELENGKTIDNSRAWLYKVLINLSRTTIKSANLHANKLTETHICDEGDNDIQKNIEIFEKQKIVDQALAKLADKDRQLLLLYHEGLSYNEIAKITDMLPGSVGTTLLRSIEKLKKIIKTQYHEMFE